MAVLQSSTFHTLQYTEVLVSINAESPARHAELTERCESYLRARCAAGEVPKKETLSEEATPIGRALAKRLLVRN
jgi:hypothetical protein